MLKARIKNVGEWKAVLNAIGDIVEDAMFIVNDAGITFRGMDAAHVALLDVTFPKSSFDLLETKTSFFGLKVDDFKKIFNACGNSDVVELDIEKEGLMKITITGSLNMEFTLRLIDKTTTNTPIPKIDYKVKAALDPTVLSRILTNIQPISEYVSINCNYDKIQFSGKGDVGDARIDIHKGNPELRNLETVETSSAVYSLDYMAKIIRSIGKATNSVSLEYSTQNPIHMLFEMPSMVKVDYYLAPRIEN